jgi:hypothetical protein
MLHRVESSAGSIGGQAGVWSAVCQCRSVVTLRAPTRSRCSLSAGARAGNTALGDGTRQRRSGRLPLVWFGTQVKRSVQRRHAKSTAPRRLQRLRAVPPTLFQRPRRHGTGMGSGLRWAATFGNGSPVALAALPPTATRFHNQRNEGYGCPYHRRGGHVRHGGCSAGGPQRLAVGAGVRLPRKQLQTATRLGQRQRRLTRQRQPWHEGPRIAGKSAGGQPDLGGWNFGFNASAGSSWTMPGPPDFTADAGDAAHGGD